MLEKGQIFRCNTCGNMFELINIGGGASTCCGTDMELLSDEPKDVGAEKHIPIIEKTDSGVKVKDWTGCTSNGRNTLYCMDRNYNRQRNPKSIFKARNALEADFMVDDTSNLLAKIYCIVHGLWRSDKLLKNNL